MSRKAQYVVVKEILSFAIGVTVVISFSLFISNLLIPNIREFVFLKKIESTAHYVDSAIFEIYLLSERTSNSNVSLKLPMPDKIADSIYTVKTNGRIFCVILQSFGSSKCIVSSLPSGVSLSGYYISGTDMKILLQKQNNISVSILNAL